MSPSPSLPSEYKHVVTHLWPPEVDLHSVVGSTDVTASYFVEEGSFTLFKNQRHAVVAAFRTELVIGVTRGGLVDVSGD